MSFPLNFFDDTEKILNSTFLGTNNSNVGVQHYQQHNFNNINFQSNSYQFNTSEMEQIPTISSPINYNTFFHNENNHQNHLSTLAVAATSAAAATFKNLTSHNVITNVTNFVLTTATNALLNNIDLGSNGGVRFDIGTSLEGAAGNLSLTNSFLFNNNINNRNENFTGIYDDNDNFQNQFLNSTITNGDHAPQLSKSALIRCIVLSAMAIVSLLGNTATMWNIYKTRMTKRPSRHNWSAIYSLIFHLSIADVLVTGFCIIGEAAWCYTVQWLASEFACKSVKFFQMFSLYLSTYVLVLIGVDRWIAVKYPMKSLNMAKRCYRLLGGAYVLSFVLSIPQFFIFRVARGPFIEDFYQCVTHGFYTAEWQEQLYTTFTLFFTFIIPLCILIVTYLSTFRTISGSEKMFQGSKLAVYTSKPAAQTNRQRLIHKAKMKSLRISVVIIVAFLICWTPYNVMMIIFMFLNPDKRLGEDLQSGIFFFGMSNSLVNPLIYGAFHLCPLKRNNSQYAHYSLTRDNSHSYQRSPSLLTATTQIDSTGRHHTFKHRSSYYQRNGSMIRRDQFDLTNSPITKKLQTVNVAGSIQAGNDVSIHLLQNNSNNSNNNVTNTQREYLLRQTSFNGNNHLKTINNTNSNTQLPMNSGGTGVSYNNGISYHHQLHHLHQNNSSVINDLSKKPKINNNNISSV